MENAPSQSEQAPDLSACILSWNAAWFLRRCLCSLFRPPAVEVGEAMAAAGLPHCTGFDTIRLEAIVVDNASPDESAAMVEREFPQVKLVRSGKNLGFP